MAPTSSSSTRTTGDMVGQKLPTQGASTIARATRSDHATTGAA